MLTYLYLSVLEILDKRIGNMVDDEGQLHQANILPGVYTNCMYTSREEFRYHVDDSSWIPPSRTSPRRRPLPQPCSR